MNVLAKYIDIKKDNKIAKYEVVDAYEVLTEYNELMVEAAMEDAKVNTLMNIADAIGDMVNSEHAKTGYETYMINLKILGVDATPEIGYEGFMDTVKDVGKKIVDAVKKAVKKIWELVKKIIKAIAKLLGIKKKPINLIKQNEDKTYSINEGVFEELKLWYAAYWALKGKTPTGGKSVNAGNLLMYFDDFVTSTLELTEEQINVIDNMTDTIYEIYKKYELKFTDKEDNEAIKKVIARSIEGIYNNFMKAIKSDGKLNSKDSGNSFGEFFADLYVSVIVGALTGGKVKLDKDSKIVLALAYYLNKENKELDVTSVTVDCPEYIDVRDKEKAIDAVKCLRNNIVTTNKLNLKDNEPDVENKFTLEEFKSIITDAQEVASKFDEMTEATWRNLDKITNKIDKIVGLLEKRVGVSDAFEVDVELTKIYTDLTTAISRIFLSATNVIAKQTNELTRMAVIAKSIAETELPKEDKK
jgi:hypothetical protein